MYPFLFLLSAFFILKDWTLVAFLIASYFVLVILYAVRPRKVLSVRKEIDNLEKNKNQLTRSEYLEIKSYEHIYSHIIKYNENRHHKLVISMWIFLYVILYLFRAIIPNRLSIPEIRKNINSIPDAPSLRDLIIYAKLGEMIEEWSEGKEYKYLVNMLFIYFPWLVVAGFLNISYIAFFNDCKDTLMKLSTAWFLVSFLAVIIEVILHPEPRKNMAFYASIIPNYELQKGIISYLRSNVLLDNFLRFVITGIAPLGFVIMLAMIQNK